MILYCFDIFIYVNIVTFKYYSFIVIYYFIHVITIL